MPKVEEKKSKERDGGRRNLRRWIVVGVIGVLAVAGMVVALVYTLQSLGLRGVSFSAESGFYERDIDLEIKPDGWFLTQPISIKYNMNGDDLENTNDLYSGAIKLEVPEEGYKLYTITVTACKKDNECTEPEVATYVLGKNLDEDVTIDIVNINSSQHNLYDYNEGIMVGGRTYDENEAVGAGGFIEGNYNNRGKGWMRDAFITRFNTGGEVIWNQGARIGISGGTSSSYAVKSLKVSIVPQDGGNPMTFRLRSGSQDQFSGNVRSSVVDRLAEESGFDGRTGSKRMVVFLNGDYYGIFDMQTTFSEQNLLQRFNLSKEKNIKRVSSSEKDVFGAFKIEEEYWDGLDSEENRKRIEEMVDMDDYLEYYAISILVNNTDWPTNNFAAWRFKNNGKTDNKYEDGRIRFLIRDTDLIYYTEGNIDWFDGAIGDIFQSMMDNENRGNSSSFRQVMSSKYYSQRFIELLRELINGPFATENVLRIIDEEAAKIEHQVKLFSSAEEYEEWKDQIELMRKAASGREGQMRWNVKEYFDTEL